jgi:hypothetical protein
VGFIELCDLQPDTLVAWRNMRPVAAPAGLEPQPVPAPVAVPDPMKRGRRWPAGLGLAVALVAIGLAYWGGATASQSALAQAQRRADGLASQVQQRNRETARLQSSLLDERSRAAVAERDRDVVRQTAMKAQAAARAAALERDESNEVIREMDRKLDEWKAYLKAKVKPKD